MLVLTRKAGEAILIGHNIEIVITRIDGDTVKLGINAPRQIPVIRKEVLADIAATNHAAALPAPFKSQIPDFKPQIPNEQIPKGARIQTPNPKLQTPAPQPPTPIS